jgi:hypothetical protein
MTLVVYLAKPGLSGTINREVHIRLLLYREEWYFDDNGTGFKNPALARAPRFIATRSRNT